jgi:hypothetical protein
MRRLPISGKPENGWPRRFHGATPGPTSFETPGPAKGYAGLLKDEE